MLADAEGFFHPEIDLDTCNDCNLCRRKCQVNDRPPINKRIRTKDRIFPKVFAIWNLDEGIRKESSSGGVFNALAENVLSRGGVVIGAAFDANLSVTHICIEEMNDLHRLRGSKYVQSMISKNLYRRIVDYLKDDRLVLFSGTPCQVAGLKGFLEGGHRLLLSCDLMCHGVPSPMLFARYLEYISKRDGNISKILFRDKTYGWNKFGVRQYYEKGGSKFFRITDDPYMVAFLRDYALRECCYKCAFSNSSRVGNVTLGDFWGVKKKYAKYDIDDKGTSLLMVNDDKGNKWLNDIRSHIFLGKADLETAVDGNPTLQRPCKKPQQRNIFYKILERETFNDLINKFQLNRMPFYRRLLLGLLRRSGLLAKIVFLIIILLGGIIS
jgi:hypothetical protein